MQASVQTQSLHALTSSPTITTKVISLASEVLPTIPANILPQGRLLTKASSGMRNPLSPAEVAQSLRQVTLPRISTLDNTLATFALMGRHVPIATPIDTVRFSRELAGTSLQNN